MNWPNSQDYNEAIQNAASSFSDPGLKGGEVTVNAIGLPVPRSGNFADVYQFKGADGKMWAVKCFTRKVAGLQERYAKIDEHLAKVKLPFTVGFKYLEKGIRVRGEWFPLLKMEWVEGFTLNEFVRDNADKPKYLHALMQMWAKMTARLRDGNMAHADLQHGNVLLVPGATPTKLGLKLIDYDGMWVPALADSHSGEVGHPNFQHPLRLKDRLYNADVDRFPHLVVASALRATLLGGKKLWDQFDNGDNLLFKESDLSNPADSAVFKALWDLKDDVLCTLIGKMVLTTKGPLRKAPWLDDLLLTQEKQRLNDEEELKVMEALGVGPHFTVSKAATAPTVNEFSDFEVDDDDDKPAPRKSKELSRYRKTKLGPQKIKSKLPLFIGGGVLVVALLGGAIALMAGGKKNGSTPGSEVEEIALNNPAVADKKAPVKPRPEDKIKQPADKKDPAKGRNSDVAVKDSEPKVPPLNETPAPPLTQSDIDFLNPGNWEGLPGKWKIDGSTIAGKTETSLPISTFLCTKKKYKDFEFLCQARLTNGVGGSGVNIRSTVDNPARFLVYGPQADMGTDSGNLLWGNLWGYRFGSDGSIVANGHMMKKADVKSLNVKPDGFNDLFIRVVGKKVTIKVNQVVAVDQEFPNLPSEGIIALELGQGTPMEVTFKNVRFKTLETDSTTQRAEKNRQSVPNAGEQGVALKRVRDIFDLDVDKIKPPEIASLSVRLYDKAIGTGNDLSSRFVLLRESRDLAVRAGRIPQALRAIDQMAEDFEIDADAEKALVLQKASAGATAIGAQRAIALAALATIDSAIGRRAFQSTDSLLATAEAAAQKSEDKMLLATVTARGVALAKATEAAATLANNPADQEANQALGEILCFLEGDWERGLPLLAKGGDAKLAPLAKRDLDVSLDGAEQVSLGDAWRERAQTEDQPAKRILYRRAIFWYEKAIPGLTGFATLKAERNLKDTRKLAPPNVPKPIARWTFLRDASDSIGVMHGTLNDGATVSNGRLRVSGKGVSFTATPLPCTIKEKTLEVWVCLPTLQVANVIQVIDLKTRVWDGILFAEQQPKKWYPGSSFRHRSRNLDAPEETAKRTDLIHVAIVYNNDDSITTYRNGKTYGDRFVPQSDVPKLQTYDKKLSAVRLGFASGAVDVKEARLYDRALSDDEIAESYRLGVTQNE